MDTGIMKWTPEYTPEREGELQQWAKEQAIKAGPSQGMAIIRQGSVQ